MLVAASVPFLLVYVALLLSLLLPVPQSILAVVAVNPPMPLLVVVPQVVRPIP